MREFWFFHPEFVFAVIDCSLCLSSGVLQKEELLKHKESTQWYTVVVLLLFFNHLLS